MIVGDIERPSDLGDFLGSVHAVRRIYRILTGGFLRQTLGNPVVERLLTFTESLHAQQEGVKDDPRTEAFHSRLETTHDLGVILV